MKFNTQNLARKTKLWIWTLTILVVSWGCVHRPLAQAPGNIATLAIYPSTVGSQISSSVSLTRKL